jgi:hypothetical protein
MEFLPVGITPPWAVVSIMPPGIIRIRIRIWIWIWIWIWIVVILSPEVNLLAKKKRVGIFQITKAHDFPPLDFTCDGDSPSSSEDIRVDIPLNQDDESSFGAFELRFFHPIKRTLQDNDERRSIFLIDGFNDLSTPNHNFALIGFWILKNLLEGERFICLNPQFLGNRCATRQRDDKNGDKKKKGSGSKRSFHIRTPFKPVLQFTLK